MAKKPHIPEGFDPNVAHLTDADGNVYQVLAPVKTIQAAVGEDEDGNVIIGEVALPREWDEEATVAAMEKGQ